VEERIQFLSSQEAIGQYFVVIVSENKEIKEETIGLLEISDSLKTRHQINHKDNF
jgi:hypothetical protein